MRNALLILGLSQLASSAMADPVTPIPSIQHNNDINALVLKSEPMAFVVGNYSQVDLDRPAVMTDSGLTVSESDKSTFSNSLTIKEDNYRMIM